MRFSSNPTRLMPPSGARRIRSDRGDFACWQISRQIYATQVRGFMTRDMSQLIMDEYESLYARGNHVSGFHDWLDMSNYESACRVELTAWVLRHREHTTLHIGVASRLVAMGVTVANLALGSLIHVHTSAETLKRALDQTATRADVRH